MLYLQAVQDLRVGGRSSAAQYQYTLQGDNVKELNAMGATDAGRAAHDSRSCSTSTATSKTAACKQVSSSIAPRPSRLGITTQMIDDTLYDAFGQRQVSTMYTPLNQYHVVMEVGSRSIWQNPDGLSYIYVRAANGGQVPLSAFTHYEPSNAPLGGQRTRGSSHRSPFRSIWRPACPSAMRSPPSRRPSRRSGCRRASTGVFRARPRRFRHHWPTSRCSSPPRW